MQPHNSIDHFFQANNIYNTAKLVVPAIFTGIKKAGIGFGLISIPTFISYFGSDSHKLEKGQEGIITSLSKSLMSMNLVSNIGQELSPILCGPYTETCKVTARLGAFATQTWVFNQTIETGIAKGAIYEAFGFSAPSFFISEAMGTMAEPVFSKLHYNHTNNQTLNFDFKDIIQDTVSNNLVRDQIVAQHIYSAMTCLFFPINGQEFPPIANSLYYLYLWSDFNSTAAYNTATNLYENAKDFLTGENLQHDEF